MPSPRRSRGRRCLGALLRWVRTLGLLLVFIVIVSGLFLNKVGLPAFFKERLVAQLRAKGWEVDFSRLRLRWRRGIVAENLHLQRTNQFAGPHVFMDEAQFRLDHDALRHFELKVTSVKLAGGRLVLPLQTTNSPRRMMTVDGIGGELHFRPDDRWELSSLRGKFLGVNIQLAGTLTNASAIRDWKFPRPTRKTGDVWPRIMRAAERVKFDGAAALEGELQGDALDFRSFDLRLKIHTPTVASPWGHGTNVSVDARLLPPAYSNDLVRAELTFLADDAQGSWGQAKSIELNMKVEPSYNRFISTNAHLTVELDDAQTRWGRAGHFSATARFNACPTNTTHLQTDIEATARQLQSDWVTATQARIVTALSHAQTNLLPAAFSGELQLEEAQTPWGNSQRADVLASGTLPPADQFHLFETNLVWPERAGGVVLNATATLTNIQSAEIQIEGSSLAAKWQSPELSVTVTNLLYRGELAVSGELDIESRTVTFSGFSTMDVHKLSSLLTAQARDFLSNYSWQTPPKAEARGRLTLPAWTHRQPDWRTEVMPTLAVSGNFEVGAGTYRAIPFRSAQSPFQFSNSVFQLPHLHVTRTEGALEGEYTSNPGTKEFHWRVRSQIDPKVAIPFFEGEAQQRAFDRMVFTTPPLVEAEIWGHWRDLNRLRMVGYATATNFTYRGESVKEASAHVIYTNRLLTLLEPQIRREGEYASAPGITFDLRQQKIYLTNALGNLNPQAVARAIGTKAGRIMEPYQFDWSPTVRVHGVIDAKKGRYEDDLHFEVSGGPFRWKQFRLQELGGNVAWQGKVVNLLNVQGQMDGGQVAGYARIDLTTSNETIFSLNGTATNIDLRLLLGRLTRTNRVEGIVSGELLIARATAQDPKSWQGAGHIHLHDGLIWDIPVFGLFSGVLNTILPGLGNSRAKEASADFVIANGLVDSRNLEIHATAMRMQFAGTVDVEHRLDARVEAELLRDLPAIGFVVSKLLWPVTKLFEYKVTGTWNDPKAEPVYVIPKILLFPFQPIKTIKELFPEEARPAPER